MKKLFIALMLVLLLVGCSSTRDKERPDPKFAQGDKVIAIISGQVGMVVWRGFNYHNKLWRYDVRFAANQQTTHVALLGDDGPINNSPLALVEYMREYELKKYVE